MGLSLVHLVFFAVLVSTQVTVNHGCGLPPKFWCSSFQVAKSCKVVKQCLTLSSPGWTAKPVNLTYLYEAFCPFCQQFVIKQLKPTWDLLEDSGIFHVELVPFGNAMEDWDKDHWKFECQHGPEECEANIIQTCTINKVGDMKKIIPFVACMEESKLKPNKSGPVCAKKHNIDYEPIRKCAAGPEGNRLEHEMFLRTAATEPQQEYVPWIIVNGMHTEKIETKAEKNLLKLVCETYEGVKPHACTSK